MQSLNILLVDDDRLVLSTLSRGLEAAGYNIDTADSGEIALEMCKKGGLDLVVLDMRMPGTDGIDIARWLRINTDIPFIFLSAYGDEDVVDTAVEEGALGYLIKPVEPSQLIAAVKAANSRSLEIRQLREKEGQLSKALSGDRAINTAIGILIQREHLNEKMAFDKIRQIARNSQRNILDVANELIAATLTLNHFS